MKNEERKTPPKKPNEIVKGTAVDHFKITDKQTGKVLVNKRG